MNATTSMFWSKGKDDYGRTAHRLYVGSTHRVVGAVVALPLVAREHYLRTEGRVVTHLSNDWTIRGEAAVAYHGSLKEAKARIEAIAASTAK